MEGEGKPEQEQEPMEMEGEGKREQEPMEGEQEPMEGEGKRPQEPMEGKGKRQQEPIEGEGEQETMEGEGKLQQEPIEGERAQETMEGEGKGEGEPMEGEGELAEIDSERVNGRDIPDTHWGLLQWLLVIICAISGFVGFSAGRHLIRSYFHCGEHTQLLQWLMIGIGLPMALFPMLDPQNRSLFVTIKYILVCGILGVAAIMISRLSSTGVLLCVISLVYSVLFTSLLFQNGITTSNLSSFICLLATLVVPGNWSSDENPEVVSRGHLLLGFVFTILASAAAGLVFPLAYLAFYEIAGEDTSATFCISLSFAIMVSNMVSIAGLLINGDFEYLMSEDRHFRPEEPEYWVTFTCNVLDWQFLFLAIVGLVYLAASLFFNFNVM